MKMSHKFDIRLTVLLRNEEHTILAYRGEYRNLMALLNDKFYIEDFGECKGIGRCGTCHIHILNDTGDRLCKANERNENVTLARMDGVQWDSRLACQIVVDETLDGLHIEVSCDNDPEGKEAYLG